MDREQCMGRLKINVLAYTLAYASYLAMGGFGFLYALQMKAGMGHCPFMPQETHCLMDTTDHYDLWGRWFASLVPLVVLCFFVCWTVWKMSDQHRQEDRWKPRKKTHEWSLPPPLYQELYRRGILEPRGW